MKITYQINEKIITDENGKKFTVYGIDAVSEDGQILKHINDVFFEKSKCKEFVSLCNKLELSICHLEDVVDNELNDQYRLKT